MLRKYFHGKCNTSILHEKFCRADSNFTPLNLDDEVTQSSEIIRSLSSKIEEWRSKPLHGRHVHDLAQNNVDKIA